MLGNLLKICQSQDRSPLLSNRDLNKDLKGRKGLTIKSVKADSSKKWKERVQRP